MNVLVVKNLTPFARDFTDAVADELVRQLIVQGAKAETLRIPFSGGSAERMLEEMMIARCLRTSNVDRVIGLQFPSFLISHPQKSLWIVDSLNTALSTQENLGPAGQKAKQASFEEVRQIYASTPALSVVVAASYQVASSVLPVPLTEPLNFISATYDDYLFVSGELDFEKSLLVLRAAASSKKGGRLVLNPRSLTEEEERAILSFTARNGLSQRVMLESRTLEHRELAGYINNALGCICLSGKNPFDSIFRESFQAAKAVITVDRGGLDGFIQHQVNGLICDPTSRDLASAMMSLWTDKGAARALGRAALAEWQLLHPTWKEVIELLLA